MRTTAHLGGAVLAIILSTASAFADTPRPGQPASPQQERLDAARRLAEARRKTSPGSSDWLAEELINTYEQTWVTDKTAPADQHARQKQILATLTAQPRQQLRETAQSTRIKAYVEAGDAEQLDQIRIFFASPLGLKLDNHERLTAEESQAINTQLKPLEAPLMLVMMAEMQVSDAALTAQKTIRPALGKAFCAQVAAENLSNTTCAEGKF